MVSQDESFTAHGISPTWPELWYFKLPLPESFSEETGILKWLVFVFYFYFLMENVKGWGVSLPSKVLAKDLSLASRTHAKKKKK